MSYFVRNAFAQTTVPDRMAFRKTDVGQAMHHAAPVPQVAHQVALDSLSSGIAPDRRGYMDDRAIRLAKMDAEEQRRISVRKAEDAHAATLGVKIMTLPAEQRRRVAANEFATSGKTVFQALYKGDNAATRQAISAAPSEVQLAMSKVSAELKALPEKMQQAMPELFSDNAAVMRRLTGQDDGPDDSGKPPTAVVTDSAFKPGTANATVKLNDEGVYADRGRPSVPPPAAVVKSEHVRFQKNVGPGRVMNAAGIDLAGLFTGMSQNPA